MTSMMKDYAAQLAAKNTPQTLPIPGHRGARQVQNHAGGYVFAVDDWTRLDRFLVLGSSAGTYYASGAKMTRENGEVVNRLLVSDGWRVVQRIVEISESGRAPKNTPAIFALAMAASFGDEPTRQVALQAVPDVCRTGTHLFEFLEAVSSMRGWGRGLRRAVANWYQDKPADKLALQLAKYQQRGGWSHRDALRLAKPVPRDYEHSALYAWATGKNADALMLKMYVPDLMKAMEDLKRSDIPLTRKAEIIRQHRVPRECVPTELLNSLEIWEALLVDMPVTAMIRNLGKMTAVGLLIPMGGASGVVTGRLHDAELLHKARVHPVQVLMALKTYASGEGIRGSLRWHPVPEIVDALEDAFYLSFANVEPAGKRTMIGIDVSGSMSGVAIPNTPLTAAEGAAAMAMVTVRTEQQVYAMGFADQFRELGITRNQRLDEVLRRTRISNFGGTDCALPMLHAMRQGLLVDTFMVITDNETWAGMHGHPVQALDAYRQKTGIPAKLVVMGMASNGFTIADPGDAGMLDVVGFDAAAPAIVADFSRG